MLSIMRHARALRSSSAACFLRQAQKFPLIPESVLRYCFSTQSNQWTQAKDTKIDGDTKKPQTGDIPASVKGNGPVLLVEKLASISDSVIGLTAIQYGPSVLLVTLYDKSSLDLEAVLMSGTTLEKVMFSPDIRQRYHKNKPLSPGTTAQDISDPTFRPFVRIVGPGAYGAIRVRPIADTDDARAFERQPDRLISGAPITTSI